MTDDKEDRAGRVDSEAQAQSPSSSILALLEAAMRARVTEMEEIVKSQPTTDEEVKELARRLIELALETDELAGWVYSEASTISSDERLKRAKAGAEKLIRMGASVSEGLEFAERAGTRPRGRPASNRPLAIMALEIRRSPSKPSWMEMTRKVCQCGKARHDFACRDRIRTAVRELEDVLERLGLSGGSEAAPAAAE